MHVPGRAVIFDVDGVLVDSYDAHMRSWLLMGREHGLTITEEQFASTFGQTSREIIARFWGSDLSREDAEALGARKEAIYRDLIRERFPAMDGSVELIDALADAGFRLAVGSSGPPENVELTLDCLGRASRFNAVVTGRDITRGKPDPQVFQIAAERLGLPPARCIVVEDAPVGITAARAAGMASVALVGTVAADRLGEADLVVRSLRELLDVSRLAALLERAP
ncbi:MAG TPA: HAD family phosphatase [Candidatus Binatia bacterium]|nr:HAD family phosphatase [Candidatus Binatia bacterium]